MAGIKVWTGLLLFTLTVVMINSAFQGPRPPCCRQVAPGANGKLISCLYQEQSRSCGPAAYLVKTTLKKNNWTCIDLNSKWLKYQRKQYNIACPNVVVSRKLKTRKVAAL